MTVYLGIPMYGGAHGLAVGSLLSLQAHLMEKGHTVLFDIVANGSILPKVRNGIVKRFIDSNAEVLVFIDSDMVYEPQAIEKLINAPFDVSVINYRVKSTNVKYMAEAVREECEVVGTVYLGDTWIQTTRAGTGIMAIKRRTIEHITTPYLSYIDNGVEYHALFDFCLSDGHYYGEDYTFCRRVEAAGGQIFILADADAGHIGDTVYMGNYHNHLKGQPS